MAKQYAYNTSTDALLHPAKSAVFFDGWQSADYENHDLLCAEMSRLAYASQDVVRKALEAKFTSVDFIGGDDLSARVKTGGTQGFIARCHKPGVTILSFRGTESDSPEDVITDLLTLPVPSQWNNCRVHGGFADRYRRVGVAVKSALVKIEGPLLITGHSLGAALATLAAVEARPLKLITFGSPLVGDPQFCRLLDGIEIHRFVDCCDVVARVPPRRFDQPHLLKLMTELADLDSVAATNSLAAELARKAVEKALGLGAAAIAKAFDLVDENIEFAHVSPPRYIFANGRVAEGTSEDEMARDQRTARAAYQHRFTIARFTEFLAGFSKLAGVGRGRVPRTLAQHLIEFLGIGQVPSRDLADHAPINYVSALAGRE
ncbi:MAG: lipase family protein [Verrucomicrobiales bacterium]|nr:lipase family protein [Verrucomicrobiales bacterium]